jgi:glycosyltransferase involved in cell wall biosynthesis
MKMAVVVLSRNRQALFRQTIESLKRTALAFERVIVDSGSTDGTEKLVAKMHGGLLNEESHTIGHAVKMGVETALESGPDLILVTANDYDYCKGWLDYLLDFWQNAPADVALCSCNVEPLFWWNTITGAQQVGKQWALRRNSVPGANWSFRASMWPEIKRLIPDKHQYDRAACVTLREAGYSIYALALAEHIGAGQRSWGKGK